MAAGETAVLVTVLRQMHWAPVLVSRSAPRDLTAQAMPGI